MHSITVVIPHLNQPAALARCLASLAAQTGAFSLSGVIVVDNGSATPPKEVCAAHENVTLLVETEPGPGPARNLGVAHAKGEILAFIDADCTADEGWLATIAAAFAEQPDAQIFGGDVRIPRRQDAAPTMIECYESVYAYRMREYIARQGFTGTGNLAVRAETMRAVGPFGGLHIAEDRDWGRRATDMGLKTIYLEDMIIYHPARETFQELIAKWDRQIAHDHAELDGLGARLKWAVKAVLLLGSPVGEIARVASSARIRGARERVLSWLCLTRIRVYRAGLMLRLLPLASARHLSGKWNRE